ncbi:MAG: penicillin-binding transpeptidase domain-containing protein [Negativibacillus sp.]
MKKQSSVTVRLTLLSLLIGLIFISFGIRLMSLQVVHGSEYKEQVQQGVTYRQQVEPTRGEILDRYGRPFAVNKVSYDIVINVAYLPTSERNGVIQKIIELVEQEGQDWIDNLPISKTEPFTFTDGPDAESQIKQLKKIAGNLTPDTDAPMTMEQLLEKYDLDHMEDRVLARKIAGVRYEMERTGTNSTTPYVFAEDISMELVMKIQEYSFDMPGIEIAQSTTREYVDGDLGSSFIGITGYISAEEYAEADKEIYQYSDRIGKNGLEKAAESLLKGTRGTREILVDAKGNVLSSSITEPATPGNTIITTIDKDLQEAALTGLENQIHYMQEHMAKDDGGSADAGAVVAVDVKTGEILAMANYPTYDLSEYYSNYSELANDPMRPLFNRATQGTYMPGSIFKPVVGVGALAEGIIDRDTKIECTHIYNRFLPYYPAQCLGTHGFININFALTVSCNIFFYEAGYQLGIEKIADYAKQLGLGVPTGIEIEEALGRVSTPELFEELRANNDPPESWEAGNVIQAAIGQLDHKFTPLQLASYTATLANNGTRMKLHLIKEVKNYTLDETIETIEPVVLNQVEADDEVWDAVREGMTSVSRDTTYGSSRYYLGSYPIVVPSKTGSPQATADKTNATFICYAPADDPEIAIAVVIENGASGQKAAPVALAILNEYFGLNQEEETSQAGTGLLP